MFILFDCFNLLNRMYKRNFCTKLVLSADINGHPCQNSSRLVAQKTPLCAGSPISTRFIIPYLVNQMKISDNGKRFPLRAVVSSSWGERVDSLCFFPLAFYGYSSFGSNETPCSKATKGRKTRFSLFCQPFGVTVGTSCLQGGHPCLWSYQAVGLKAAHHLRKVNMVTKCIKLL